MGFNAAEVVPKLEYDFRPHVNAHGVTPEPSGEKQAEFVTRFHNLMLSIQRVGMARIEAERERVDKLTEEERQAQLDQWAGLSWDQALAMIEADSNVNQDMGDPETSARQMAELVEEMSAGAPSADEIMQLPGRIRSAYFGWIVGQLSDPELWAAASKKPLAALLNGGSTT